MSKNFLFYSLQCEFCLEVIEIVKNYSLVKKGVLTCINIDTNSVNLPASVDRVPLIITTDGKVLIDDDVVQYVTSISIASLNPLMEDGQSNYSFIDENEGTKEMASTKTGFDFVSNFGEPQIPKDSRMSAADMGKGQRFDAKSYEQFTKSREDDNKSFQPQARV